MFQPRLFMNMEPDPLDFSVLNNSLRTPIRTKGPAQKANQRVLWVSPRGLIPVTPSGIGGNNIIERTSESTPPSRLIRQVSKAPFLRDRALHSLLDIDSSKLTSTKACDLSSFTYPTCWALPTPIELASYKLSSKENDLFFHERKSLYPELPSAQSSLVRPFPRSGELRETEASSLDWSLAFSPERRIKTLASSLCTLSVH